jgi:hypothetical protein
MNGGTMLRGIPKRTRTAIMLRSPSTDGGRTALPDRPQ